MREFLSNIFPKGPKISPSGAREFLEILALALNSEQPKILTLHLDPGMVRPLHQGQRHIIMPVPPSVEGELGTGD